MGTVGGAERVRWGVQRGYGGGVQRGYGDGCRGGTVMGAMRAWWCMGGYGEGGCGKGTYEMML